MICDDVRWVWLGGMGYAHTTTEQPCHDTYMMNEHDPSMLQGGSIMGATHAGGGEGLGGPPGLPLKVKDQGPSRACGWGHSGTPRQYHLCTGGWVVEAAAQGWAVVGLGLGGCGAGRRGAPGVGTPSNADERPIRGILGEISPKGHMAPLSMLLHIRLLASTLGGSSGVELARARSNGDRRAARCWRAGGPRTEGAKIYYNCNRL